MNITSAEFVKGVIGTDPILEDGLPQVAFVGRSNVGKSSVINSLVNRCRLVKTGKRPGKTLEINFFLINQAFYLVDLPGYGFAKVDLKMAEKLRKLILWYIMYSKVRPYLVVIILDVKVGFTAFDQEMVKLLEAHQHPFIIVVNKIDKLNTRELAARLAAIKAAAGGAEIIPYSAIGDRRSGNLLGRVIEGL